MKEITVANSLILFLMFCFCVNLVNSHVRHTNSRILPVDYDSISSCDQELNQCLQSDIVKDPVENFYLITIEDTLFNQEHYTNRDVKIKHVHGERHKLRWVFGAYNSILVNALQKISESQNYATPAFIFLSLYSLAYGIVFFLIYVFIIMILFRFDNNPTTVYGIATIGYLLMVTYVLFFRWQGGEYLFASFETLFLTSALYFVFRRDRFGNISFAIICALAPLVRESGILVSILFGLYQKVVNGRVEKIAVIFPIISVMSLVLLNLDIVSHIFDYGFLITFEPVEGQSTWTYQYLSQSPYVIMTIFYNYIIFLVPILLFYQSGNKLQLFTLILIIIYFIIFTVATVIENMPVRLMPSVLIIVYCFFGALNIKSTNDYR